MYVCMRVRVCVSVCTGAKTVASLLTLVTMVSSKRFREGFHLLRPQPRQPLSPATHWFTHSAFMRRGRHHSYAVTLCSLSYGVTDSRVMTCSLLALSLP